MFGDAIFDAALSGLFAYMGGPIASQMNKIAKKGFLSTAKNFYTKEIKNAASTIAEEALTTITAGVTKFTALVFQQTYAYTAELWSN